jgi:hypothetical protein
MKDGIGKYAHSISQTMLIIDICGFHFGIPGIRNAIDDVKIHKPE